MSFFGRFCIYIFPYYFITWIISTVIFGWKPFLIGSLIFLFYLLLMKSILVNSEKQKIEIDNVEVIDKFPDFKKINLFTILGGYKTYKLNCDLRINNNERVMRKTIYIISKQPLRNLKKDDDSLFTRTIVRRLGNRLYFDS